MSDTAKLYNKDRDPEEFADLYISHVMAMTAEGLHSKADIAKELAYRDSEIAAAWKSVQAWESEAGAYTRRCSDLEGEIAALKAEVVELREALECVGHNGNCWCGVAIGDPRYSGHSAACKRAAAALAKG